MMSGTITLQRGEARYNLNTGRTYTAEQIARMFQVSPSSVWLRERFGTRVFFPNAEGTFDFSAEDEYNHLDVEGGTLPSSPNPQATATVSSVSSNSSNHFSRGYPGFSSVVNQFGGRRQGSGLTLKVIQARIMGRARNGRPSFQVLDQIFLDVAEATANVHHISALVKREFGEDHVVVTADGLEVRDSSGTQGTHRYCTTLILAE